MKETYTVIYLGQKWSYEAQSPYIKRAAGTKQEEAQLLAALPDSTWNNIAEQIEKQQVERALMPQGHDCGIDAEHCKVCRDQIEKPLKGLRLSILHDKRLGNCSNGGISARCSEVTLVGEGIAEIFEATPDAPAVRLVERKIGSGYYKHVEPIEPVKPGHAGYMSGGAFVTSCDSRFSELSQYPLSLHDRQEAA